MLLRAIAGLVAVTLLLAYLAPVVLKLLDPALTAVVLLGTVLMLLDLWQSLQSRNE